MPATSAHAPEAVAILPELVRTLTAMRGLTSVGVELFSDAMDALPAPEVRRRVADAPAAALTAAPNAGATATPF
jgi:hypothetical protein